jgi:Na+/melibiose symporter-like transporter
MSDDSDQAKVAENDLRKLHAEVNQLVSQRFYLTTIAVLVFATMCGLATSAVSKDRPLTANFVSLVAILVLFVLAALFAYFMLLLGMMRIFTVYITKKYKSPWEEDWARYRKNKDSRKYFGYSKAGTTVFCILGALSILFLWLLFVIGGVQAKCFPHVFYFPLISFVVYEISIVWVAWRRDTYFNEGKISIQWEKAIHEADEQRKMEAHSENGR